MILDEDPFQNDNLISFGPQVTKLRRVHCKQDLLSGVLVLQYAYLIIGFGI